MPGDASIERDRNSDIAKQFKPLSLKQMQHAAMEVRKKLQAGAELDDHERAMLAQLCHRHEKSDARQLKLLQELARDVKHMNFAPAVARMLEYELLAIGTDEPDPKERKRRMAEVRKMLLENRPAERPGEERAAVQLSGDEAPYLRPDRWGRKPTVPLEAEA